MEECEEKIKAAEKEVEKFKADMDVNSERDLF